MPIYAMIERMEWMHPARAHFRALIRVPDAELNLAEAALCVAWEDQDANRVHTSLRTLDALAAAADAQVAASGCASEVVAALNHALFRDAGFHGNTWDYHALGNSFLDCVLEARYGLPIALSIIYLEVGWRLGLPVSGVALPGHFLVRYTDVDNEIFIDPFNRGRIWSRAECITQIAVFYGKASLRTIAGVLRPPTRRAILVRMLRNLKNLYIERADFPQALAAAERIVLLEPAQAQEVRDRGLLRARLNQYNGALEDFDRYARLAPQATDLGSIRQQAREIAARAAAGN